jgi:hypothetical protein
MVGARNFMVTLKQQSPAENHADLNSFMDEYQSELFLYPSPSLDSSPGDSYPSACRLQAPFLANFIIRKIDDLFFVSDRNAVYASLARAIFHLYSGCDAAESNYTAPAWRIAVGGDATLLNLLLSNCCSYEKTIGRKKILDKNDKSIFIDTAAYCKQWNLLAEAAVFNRDIRIVSQIAASYPTAVAPALEALTVAAKLFEQFPQAIFRINPEDIRRARHAIILALKSPRHDFYTVSYEDKRDIEKYFLAKIQDLRSAKDVLDFHQSYRDTFVLNQHRIYSWACFKQFLFWQPELPYSTIRCRVLEGLQKKFFEIVSQYTSPLVIAEGREILFAETHFSRGVSVEWRDRMNTLFKTPTPLQEITRSLTRS